MRKTRRFGRIKGGRNDGKKGRKGKRKEEKMMGVVAGAAAVIFMVIEKVKNGKDYNKRWGEDGGKHNKM
jgi:hypothetical protein